MANKTRKIAFNTHLIFFFLLIALFLFVSVDLLISDVNGSVPLALGGFALVSAFVFGVAISPIVFIFDEENLTIVYVLGNKEIIPWKEIRSVTKRGGSFSGKLSTYQIAHPVSEKRPFYVDSSITCDFKTKKLMKEYYKKDIK